MDNIILYPIIKTILLYLFFQIEKNLMYHNENVISVVQWRGAVKFSSYLRKEWSIAMKCTFYFTYTFHSSKYLVHSFTNFFNTLKNKINKNS